MIQDASFKSLLILIKFNDTVLAKGTGFIVNSKIGPLLITNRHNVTGRHNITNKLLSKTGAIPNKITITHNKKNKIGEWITKDENILINNEIPLWHEHPTLQEKADFVAIALTDIHNVEILDYDITKKGPQFQCNPADTVSVIGFPFGITGGIGSIAIWATGFIATEIAIDYEQLPIFLIDCRTRPGQSGSPVISHKNGGVVTLENGDNVIFEKPVNNLLGIYSGRINNDSDLGTVWKSTAILELVKSIENTSI